MFFLCVCVLLYFVYLLDLLLLSCCVSFRSVPVRFMSSSVYCCLLSFALSCFPSRFVRWCAGLIRVLLFLCRVALYGFVSCHVVLLCFIVPFCSRALNIA